MELKPITDILVKPAGPDCNMACTYCFYSDRVDLFPGMKTRMSHDILEEMIKQVMEPDNGQVSVGWQGGEPTLMGLPFYYRAVELFQRYGKGRVVGNGLQTNGLLLDKKWIKLFRNYSFLIGLSIDGPEHVHDHYRRLKGGRGSWSIVLDKTKLLLDSEVAVNALTVVNDYSAGFPDEIYDFHKGQGLAYMQFIPCVETDRDNSGRAARFSVSSEKYGDFLCRVFDRWISDFVDGKPTTSIRFFESLLITYAGYPPPECTLMPECGNYIVVEHNGDVFSCDFFVEPQWKLGNLMENNLFTLLNSEKQREFGRIKLKVSDECISCDWLKYCRGGCTKDRIRDSGDLNMNHFCSAFKKFFRHADERFRRLVDEWKRNTAE